MLVCVCSMWHQLLSLWSSSCKYLVFVSRLTPQSALQSLNYPVSGSQTIVVLTCDNRKSIINNKNNISLSFIIHKNQMHFTSIFMDRWITVKMLCKKGLMFLKYIYITAFYFFLLSFTEQPSLYCRGGEQWRHLSANGKPDTEGATNGVSSCLSGGPECLFCCFSTLIVSSELSLREIDLFRLQ